jgi:RNA polymerase sigma-70 factor (ECF subfamily)
VRSDAGRKGREDGRELDDLTLARAQRGERDALRALIERYQVTVFAFLGRMLLVDRDHAAVKDLAQETMVRVVQRLAEFHPNGPARLSTWILTIATNLAIDELRRRKRRRGTGLVDAAELASAEGERPDRIAARREQVQAVAAAVARLSPEHRAAFLLREAHDMTYDEIARALGIDVGTVKSRLGRARSALRAALGAELEPE